MTERIPLSGKRGAGRFALVDDADADLVSGVRWFCHNAGPRSHTDYVRGRREGHWIYMHVLLMGQTGIDHRDGDGLNCQRYNLRVATQGQNGANMRPHTGTSSRYKGVSRDASDKWRAKIQIGDHQRVIGLFTDEADAARAYDRAALEAWGTFARLNFSHLNTP